MLSPKPEEFVLLLDVFREGLILNIITVNDVISWADDIIRNTDEPDYFFIDVSLNSNKNKLIEIISMYTAEINSPICVRVLLGLLYRKFISENSPSSVEKTARLLESFTSFDLLTSFETNYLYQFGDFDLFYLNDAALLEVEIINFLKEYDPFTLDNYLEWTKINVEVETVLTIKATEVNAAAIRKQWEGYSKSIISENGISADAVATSIGEQWEENSKSITAENVVYAIILFLTLLLLATSFYVFSVEWGMLWPASIVLVVYIVKWFVKRFIKW